MDMTPLQFPELPEPPKKTDYENAQFDTEAPHLLSGVMNRWVAPEGYTGKEESYTFMTVVPPVVKAEEEVEKISFPSIREEKYTFNPLFLWIFGGLFFLLFCSNIYFVFFRK